MSVSTNDIKKKISATENMSKITKAMQMVSVAKLGKIESRIAHFREYHVEVKNVLSALKDFEYIREHPFVTGRPKKKDPKIGCVLITSNRGLVGGYNNNLFKMLKNDLSNDFKFYVTGGKGAIFARGELPSAWTENFLFPDELQYTDIMEFAGRIVTDYITGVIDEVVIIHQDFVSKIEQTAVKKNLLPLEFEANDPVEKVPNFEINPSAPEVCDSLLIQYVMTSLYEVFLSANQAEHAARMNSMSNATDNAEDIIKESKLLYNRARQAAITQELNEIVAGANAVNN